MLHDPSSLVPPFSTSPPPLPPSFIVSRSETNSHENPSTFRSFLEMGLGIALEFSVGKPYIILTICRCKKKQWRNGADQLPIYPRLSISVAGIKHKVPKYMKAPIYIYYQLDNYYQNHRRFSRGTEELKVNRKNIAWKSDRYHKFGKHVYPFNFQNGTLIGGGNLDPNIPRCLANLVSLKSTKGKVLSTDRWTMLKETK
ncbi:putative ALA-interacting subunit 2, partial [Camellia lanceoleosa]